MLATLRTLIERKTAGELTQELATRGSQLLVGTLKDLKHHRKVQQPEDGVTYAKKVDKAEARMDFTANANRSSGKCAPLRPHPARSSSWRASGSRFSPPMSSKARERQAPCWTTI